MILVGVLYMTLLTTLFLFTEVSPLPGNYAQSHNITVKLRASDDILLSTEIDHESHIHVVLNLTAPSVLVAFELCSYYSANPRNLGVCYFNVFNTLKITKSFYSNIYFRRLSYAMNIIRNLGYVNSSKVEYIENSMEPDAYEHYKMGTSKAILSVYDSLYYEMLGLERDDKRVDSIMNNVNICIVGRFSLRTLTALLIFKNNFLVHYFVDGATYKDIYGMATLQHLFDDFKLAFFPFSEFNSIDNCDVIHIVGGDKYYLDYLMNILQKSNNRPIYSYIHPYSTVNYKTIIWERDYIDFDSVNVGDSFNFSIHGAYIPDETFMEAIFLECSNSDYEIICNRYKYFLNLFFKSDSNLDEYEDRKKKNSVSSSGYLVSSHVEWILNNTWQTSGKYCTIQDTDGFFIHCLCSADFVDSKDVMRAQSHFLTEVVVGNLYVDNRNSGGLMTSRNHQFERPETIKLLEQVMSHVSYDPLLANPAYLDIIVIITYTIRVFRENAYGIQQALKTLGYTNVVIVPMLTLEYYRFIRGKYGSLYSDREFNMRSLQIAIAPHEEQMMLQQYVVVQMEQVWSPYFTTIYPRFKHILSRAKSIWTFSHKLKLDMISLGHLDAYEIPVYTDGERSVDVHNTYQIKYNEAIEQKLITYENDAGFFLNDIFMFGSFSQRRGDFFHHLIDSRNNGTTMCRNRANANYYADLDVCTAEIDHLRLGCRIGGFDVAVLDDERDKLVMRSKIIANIHHDTHSSLEVHRINYLLSLGKIIISERSLHDPELDKRYEDVLVFLNSKTVDDMVNEISSITSWLLSDRQFMLKIEKLAYSRYHDIIKNQLNVLNEAMNYSLHK